MRRLFVALIIAVSSVAVGLAGQAAPRLAPAAVRQLPYRSVPTTYGRVAFYLQDPAAQTCAAWCSNDHRRAKDGSAIDPSPGFQLDNQVLIRPKGRRLSASLHSVLPATTKPVAGLRGYWLAQTATVAEAIDLAELLDARPDVRLAAVTMAAPYSVRSLPTDPGFPLQWHLNNTLNPIADVNAESAWDAGLTGAGVVIGIVDTAIETDHPDLVANFDPNASRPFSGPVNVSHGTSVAGIAAASAFNGLVGSGMAYDARFSTLVLGTDVVNAQNLGWRNDLNDIKNNSWGPLDNGQADIPSAVIMDAIVDGVTNGRGGLGEVYVWAAGNGRAANDRVEYDPYASSRYTISVGAVGDLDQDTVYSEQGSSLMLVTQSSGNNRSIYTTTIGGGATTLFGMTSAAAPLASGVAALVLQARPDLTWRDVRQVLIDSARKCDPNNPGWDTNAAGRDIHYSYGFGAIDAGAAVALAQQWQRLPHQVDLTTGTISVNAALPDNGNNGVTRTVEITDDLIIETVELVVNVQSTFIGDLFIDTVSPAGTRSVVAKKRNDGQHNYVDYVFTTVRPMGEHAAGTWTVRIADRAAGDNATWVDYELRIHGIPVCPLDLDGDGMIALGDVQAMLASYGACDGDAAFNPAADITNDGCIGIGDLGELLATFGQTCP